MYLAIILCPPYSPSPSCLSKGSSQWNPIESNKYLHSHTFIYSKQMLFNDSKYMYQFE